MPPNEASNLIIFFINPANKQSLFIEHMILLVLNQDCPTFVIRWDENRIGQLLGQIRHEDMEYHFRLDYKAKDFFCSYREILQDWEASHVA